MKLFTLIGVIIPYLITTVQARRLIIIRHGEKISDDYLGLNDEGEARAQCLYTIFNKNTEYGQPQSIYSNKRGNRSHRPYDTVKPLADRLGLTVQEFHKYEPEEFVQNTLNNDKSSIILLSSAREWIPSLIAAIGYKVSDDIDEFDNIWVIENDDKKGHGTLSIKKQHLESCMDRYLSSGKISVQNVRVGQTTTTTKKTTTKTTVKTTSKRTTTRKTTTTKTTSKKTTTRKTTASTYRTASSSNKYRCGSYYRAVCPKGQCCSKYNYCGRSSKHCGVGCQTRYGMCY